MTHDPETVGERRPKSARARAEWISDTLHNLLGRPAHTMKLKGGGFRVMIRIDPSHLLADAMALALLRVLSRGDNFGHAKNSRWEHAWSDVHPPEEDEVQQQ
ncbi:hypothetical protein AB0O31_23150 [Kitasatospora cineracea]|uniref:hypothetical protein n=1 Tax=Kitasatospora cineracea TaxID=88074 RepID=UPI003447FA67